MSLFLLPKKVSTRIEMIQKDFLWVLFIREKATLGGLTIKKLSTPNKALLGKWIWRFALENQVPLEVDYCSEVQGGGVLAFLGT